MAELLDRTPDVDAVFAAADLTALGAIRVLAERGLSVPDQIAVASIAGADAARRTVLPVAVVRRDSA